MLFLMKQGLHAPSEEAGAGLASFLDTFVTACSTFVTPRTRRGFLLPALVLFFSLSLLFSLKGPSDEQGIPPRRHPGPKNLHFCKIRKAECENFAKNLQN